MEAAQFVHSMIARDTSLLTAHQAASQADPAATPEIVARLVQLRADAYASRRDSFDAWQAGRAHEVHERKAARDRDVSLNRASGYSLDI